MPPKTSIPIQIPIQHLKDNHSALEKLSRCLDRTFRHTKCWLHFAEEMKIDSKTICQCKIYSEDSPTVKLFEYLKAARPQLLVRDLKNALIQIERIDIHDMISKIGIKEEENVSEVITDSPSNILDEIAQELDLARKPIGNWEKLAQVLEVHHADYQKFAMYSDYNPTVALVRHLYATREEPILLKDFVDCFKEMKREDVLIKMEHSIKDKDITGIHANEVLKVGSDVLQEIAVLLNRDIQGVGGWRKLAMHFNVDPSTMDGLEPLGNMEVHSPTTTVIDWLSAARPNTTVNDVANALMKIKRSDALKILRSYFDVDVPYDEGNSDEVLGIVADLNSTHAEIDKSDEPVDRRCSTPTTEPLFGIQATEQRESEVGKCNFGLPSKTIELIARDEEKKELMDSLTEDYYQMVVLHSPTGCGKTTLVVNVAHDIIQDQPGYRVLYVDSKNVFSCSDLAYKILTTYGIASSRNSPKSQVVELFSHTKENCILILENLDRMYNSIDKMNKPFTMSNQASSSYEEFPWAKGTEFFKKEEFQDFLKDLAKSAPKLKVIVTTWELVTFVGINVKYMRLNLLSDKKSLELLRSRIDKSFRLEDQAEAIHTIIRCCGGIPLLLSAAVVVVTELGSVDAGAKMLSTSPPGKQVEILSPKALPEDERLNHCLGLCFERMNVDSKEVLVLLSVFPNAFTVKEAQHIAEGSKIDKEQLEEGFQSLRKFCFLNTYDVKSEKYILHPAVRSFGVLKGTQEEKEIEEEKRETLKSVFEPARWRYIFYTFKILSEIEEEFFSTQSRSAIEKYKLQDENIREIARWCITDKEMDVKVKRFCIQSFIDCQSALLKLMRSHPLKLILCKFCQLCQTDKNLAQLYCECLILGGAKIVIGCLCTPYMCSSALNEAIWCFLKAFQALKTESSEASKDRTISDLVSFDVPRVIMKSDAISNQAKARFLIKGGKCLVRYGYKDVGFNFIQSGIRIRSQCFKNSPKCKKHRVMLAVGCNDFAAACTYSRQHKEAVLLREQTVLPIYSKELGVHPFTATAHSQLARNYLELGDYDKAVKASDIALRYRKALLGDHQDTARSLFDKGVILSQQASVLSEATNEKYEEALNYLEEALQMQQKVLDTPEETLKTLQEVVVVLDALGRTGEVNNRMKLMSGYVKKIKANYHHQQNVRTFFQSFPCA